jgi:hypothetical protein
MLRPKKKEKIRNIVTAESRGKKQNRDHEMEQNPSEDLAMHEGDNPLL